MSTSDQQHRIQVRGLLPAIEDIKTWLELEVRTHPCKGSIIEFVELSHPQYEALARLVAVANTIAPFDDADHPLSIALAEIAGVFE